MTKACKMLFTWMRTKLSFGAPKQVSSSSTSVQPETFMTARHAIIKVVVFWAPIFAYVVYEEHQANLRFQEAKLSQPKGSASTLKIDQESGKKKK